MRCQHLGGATGGGALTFLHVLDRHPEKASARDFSGSLGLGAQEALLQQLSALDEQHSGLAQEHGRQILAGAQARAASAGLSATLRQRHGTLVDTLLDMEADTRLIVLGRHGRPEQLGKRHLDHNIERVVRAAHRPVLVTTDTFRPPTRFVLAFDGSDTGRAVVRAASHGALLNGLRCHIVTVGHDSHEVRSAMAWAYAEARAASMDIDGVAVVDGDAEAALLRYLDAHDIELLVMGAYGHSRIRQFILGSTTTTMLRTCPRPVLVMR